MIASEPSWLKLVGTHLIQFQPHAHKVNLCNWQKEKRKERQGLRGPIVSNWFEPCAFKLTRKGDVKFRIDSSEIKNQNVSNFCFTS